jgi:hypothetical protein
MKAAQNRRQSERNSESLMTSLQQEDSGKALGSLDGAGAGDHDQPHLFGARPRSNVPYPFNTRQYARLLVLRSRFRDAQDPDLRPAA